MKSKIFKLNINDWIKGCVMAMIGGAIIVIYSAFTGDGCGVKCIDWELAMNTGIGASIAYIIKNFFTDATGKLGGAI